MPKGETTRREREKLRHRREILDAALVLFSEHGFHNVSMQMVAATAEFGTGTLYSFFRNKEDLYHTLIVELADRFHQTLTNAIGSGSDEIENLRNYVTAKALVFSANLNVVRLYYRETTGASFNFKAGLASEIRAQHTAHLEGLARVFADGIKKKQFNRIADPYFLALTLDSLTNAILLGSLEDLESRPYPHDPDELLNIFFKGLLVA